MKKLLLFFLLIIAATPARSLAQDVSMFWRTGQKLTWNDFQGAPDKSSNAPMQPHLTLEYSFESDANGKITISVLCALVKNKSWKKPEAMTPQNLAFMQGCFDLAEAYARKARKELEDYAYHQRRSDNTQYDLDAIWNRVFAEFNDQNSKYYSETNWGANSFSQNGWNQKISKWLTELSIYSVKS